MAPPATDGEPPTGFTLVGKPSKSQPDPNALSTERKRIQFVCNTLGKPFPATQAAEKLFSTIFSHDKSLIFTALKGPKILKHDDDFCGKEFPLDEFYEAKNTKDNSTNVVISLHLISDQTMEKVTKQFAFYRWLSTQKMYYYEGEFDYSDTAGIGFLMEVHATSDLMSQKRLIKSRVPNDCPQFDLRKRMIQCKGEDGSDHKAYGIEVICLKHEVRPTTFAFKKMKNDLSTGKFIPYAARRDAKNQFCIAIDNQGTTNQNKPIRLSGLREDIAEELCNTLIRNNLIIKMQPGLNTDKGDWNIFTNQRQETLTWLDDNLDNTVKNTMAYQNNPPDEDSVFSNVTKPTKPTTRKTDDDASVESYMSSIVSTGSIHTNRKQGNNDKSIRPQQFNRPPVRTVEIITKSNTTYASVASTGSTRNDSSTLETDVQRQITELLSALKKSEEERAAENEKHRRQQEEMEKRHKHETDKLRSEVTKEIRGLQQLIASLKKQTIEVEVTEDPRRELFTDATATVRSPAHKKKRTPQGNDTNAPTSQTSTQASYNSPVRKTRQQQPALRPVAEENAWEAHDEDLDEAFRNHDIDLAQSEVESQDSESETPTQE